MQVVRLITDTVSRIANLQRCSVVKDCEKNILTRGMERNVILKRDLNIQSIVTDLFSSPFHDRDEIIKFQHFMYKNLMSLKVKSNEKEVSTINCIIAKQRRFLKTITTNDVFKLCVDFLDGKKASCMIQCGKENENVWKAALVDKDEQVESLDKWLKLSSAITTAYKYDDFFLSEKMLLLSDLTVSTNESINIDSTSFPGTSVTSDGFDLTAFNVIDADIASEYSKDDISERANRIPVIRTDDNLTSEFGGRQPLMNVKNSMKRSEISQFAKASESGVSDALRDAPIEPDLTPEPSRKPKVIPKASEAFARKVRTDDDRGDTTRPEGKFCGSDERRNVRKRPYEDFREGDVFRVNSDVNRRSNVRDRFGDSRIEDTSFNERSNRNNYSVAPSRGWNGNNRYNRR